MITGDYILTLHQRAISLPEVLDPEPPAGRSEQYVVYAILDAMVATGFDALNEAELTLEGMQVIVDRHARAPGSRMGTLRAVNSRLASMRRRLGPQRGIFERISEEIGRIEGLAGRQRAVLRAHLLAAQPPRRRDRRRLRRRWRS